MGWGKTEVSQGGVEEYFKRLSEAREYLAEIPMARYPRKYGDPKNLIEVYVW